MFESNDWLDADYQMALSHLEAGRLADAELLLRATLAMEPNHAPAWCSLGIVLMRSEQTAEAVDCFTRAITLQPDAGGVWVNMAQAMMRLGRGEEAVAALDSAAELLPDLPAVWELQVSAYMLVNKPEQALAAAERAIAIDPASVRLLHLKGCVHRRLMQLDEAAACLSRVVELAPDSADAWGDFGTVLQTQLQYDKAKHAYRRAIGLAPGHMLATLNLAQMLLNMGDLDETSCLLDEIGDARDKSPDLLRIAGDQARLSGHASEAILLYQRSLVLRPDHAETLNNLGLAFQAVSLFQEAVDSFQRAATLTPHDAKPWASLATLLSTTGQLDQVASFYGNAIILDPHQPVWLESMAWALFELGRVSDAISAFERATALLPDDLATESRLLYCQSFLPDSDPQVLAQRIKGWGKKMMLQKKEPAWLDAVAPTDTGRPLRIGYLLPNMRSHPIQPFIEPLLAAHDHTQVDPIVYTTTPDSASLPPSLARTTERWRFLGGADGKTIADQIRRDGIDLLIDVNGLRPGHRLDVLIERAAPIQLAWLVATGLGTGLACVDAAIGDDLLTPPETENLFVEKTLRPFAAYSCYRGADAAPEPSAREASRPLTFGYVGRIARLNDHVVACWAALLAACPDSVLLLDHGSLRQPGPQAHIRARFAAHGIDSARIEAGFSAPVWSAWQRIDMALDPFPSSAGASVLEGLWMGVPSVTLAGTLPSGRFGAAILPHVGLGDWVAGTPDAYIARALAAAQDRDALAELRRVLRTRLAASPLCDARGFAAALEATYRTLWQDYCGAR